MAQETFKAVTTHPGTGMQVKIQARQHAIIADEPAELGGTDTGANPVELLLGALGACQSVVAQVYAEKFGISYEELRIELEGDLDLDGFLGQADVRPGFSDVRYRYYLKTDAPAEKVREFVEFIARHCPVGDTIENQVRLTPSDVVIEAPQKRAA